jgi:hypothetical protein
LNRDPGGFHFDTQRRWLVLFFDPLHRLRFWDVFNVPGFRHCALLAYQQIAACWLYLDYAADGTCLSTIEADQGWRLIQKILRSGGTILEWQAPKKKPQQPLLYPPNCVSFCQQFLGVRKLAWTPYGLALCLSDRGAKAMFGSTLPRRRQHALWRAFGPDRHALGRSADAQADAGDSRPPGPAEMDGRRDGL